LLSVESGRARRQCVGMGVISTQLDTWILLFRASVAVLGGVLLGKRSSATAPISQNVTKLHVVSP
jgi:hypothetical protein